MDIDLSLVSEQCTNALDETLLAYGAMNKLNESVEILNKAIHDNPSTVMQKAAEFKSQTRKSVMGAMCVGKSSVVNAIVQLESKLKFLSVSEKGSESERVENVLQVISSALFLSVSDIFINDLIKKLEFCQQNENVENLFHEGFSYESTGERVLLEDPMEETLDEFSDVLSCEEADIGEIGKDWSFVSYDNDLDDSIFNDFSLGKSEEIKLINQALYDVEDINSSLEVTLSLVEHLSALHNAHAAVPSKSYRSLVESKHFTSCSSLAAWKDSPVRQLWTETDFDELEVGQLSDRSFINRHSMMKLKRIKIMYECESAIIQMKHATTASSHRDDKADGYIFRKLTPQMATPEMMHSPARPSLSRLSLRGSTPRSLRSSMSRSKGTPI
jgi:hypothetical protein